MTASVGAFFTCVLKDLSLHARDIDPLDILATLYRIE